MLIHPFLRVEGVGVEPSEAQLDITQLVDCRGLLRVWTAIIHVNYYLNKKKQQKQSTV